MGRSFMQLQLFLTFNKTLRTKVQPFKTGNTEGCYRQYNSLLYQKPYNIFL
jgi:hypothetical protein